MTKSRKSKPKHRLPRVTLEVALELLDVLGCGTDPVAYKIDSQWVETYVSELEVLVKSFAMQASAVRVYFAGGKCRWFRGTVADLLAERLGMPHNAERTKAPRPANKGYHPRQPVIVDERGF